MLRTRKECDALGSVCVPEECYWRPQTQRSIENFKIGEEKMPPSLIRGFGLQKQGGAEVNMGLGLLDPVVGQAIIQAAGEVAQGKWAEQFPLLVWQRKSGTQTHMNINEVIANRAIELLGGIRGQRRPVHPNDHVNKSQSSNDSFPTAMHIAVVLEIHDHVLPALQRMAQVLEEKATAWIHVIKIGRTHLQDATPFTAGQELSAFAAQVRLGIQRVQNTLPHLYALAQGGTAVGTGLNAPPRFGELFAEKIRALTGHPFYLSLQ